MSVYGFANSCPSYLWNTSCNSHSGRVLILSFLRDSRSLLKCLLPLVLVPSGPHTMLEPESCLGLALLMSVTCVQTWDAFLLPLGKVCGAKSSLPPPSGDHVQLSNAPELPCSQPFLLLSLPPKRTSSFFWWGFYAASKTSLLPTHLSPSLIASVVNCLSSILVSIVLQLTIYTLLTSINLIILTILHIPQDWVFS